MYHALKAVLKNEGHSTAVGDEGGFGPALRRNEDALVLIAKAIEAAGHRPGEHVAIALDPASSSFFEGGRYISGGRSLAWDVPGCGLPCPTLWSRKLRILSA